MNPKGTTYVIQALINSEHHRSTINHLGVNGRSPYLRVHTRKRDALDGMW